jgi:hypothetical protein
MPAHHLISQDTIDTIMMQRRHPIETLDLIVPHCTALDDYGYQLAPQLTGSVLTRWAFLEHKRCIRFFTILQHLLVLFFLGLPMASIATDQLWPSTRIGTPSSHSRFLALLRGFCKLLI